MSMSSMDPSSSGLPVSSSYPERLNNAEGPPSTYAEEGKAAAMLMTSNPSSYPSQPGQPGPVPAPFRPIPTRQYAVPNSLPAVLPTSGKD